MRPFLLLVMVVWSAAAFAGSAPVPEQELHLSITPGTQEVELGKAFPIVVKRRWDKELVPESWSDDTLSPLVVRLVEVSRHEDENVVEETRRYRSYAFSLHEIVLPPPLFRAKPRGGGEERVVSGNGFTLKVRPSLIPELPGPVELPGPLLPEPKPMPWILWSGGGTALLALAFLLWYGHARARSKRALAAAIPPPPHLKALERLQGLREWVPETMEETDAYHVEASALMRDYAGQRYQVPVQERTSEEFVKDLETVPALQASDRKKLTQVLKHCDLVKYGDAMPGASEREHLLEDLERFIKETRSLNIGEGGDTS